MLSFLSFKWLLKFIYLTSKFSGYHLITIDFRTPRLKLEKDIKNCYLSIVSLAFSILTTICTTYYPVTDIINSKILEIGCNLSIKGLVFGAAVYKVISTLQRRKFVSILSHMELCNSKVNFASFEALKPINFSISVGENCRKTRQKIGFVCCCFDCGFLQCLVGADGVDDDGITGLDGVEDSSEAAQLGSLWSILFVAHLVHWKLHGAAANFLEPVEITERSSQSSTTSCPIFSTKSRRSTRLTSWLSSCSSSTSASSQSTLPSSSSCHQALVSPTSS
jgi:hypothetical protein